jgi:hypothetical protein
MKTLTIPQKDKGYYLNFTLTDSTGAAINLATYTIKLQVWNPGKSETLILSGTCTIDSAPAGTCYYLLTATDFTVPGKYLAELQLSRTGVIESTENIQIIVQESGG